MSVNTEVYNRNDYILLRVLCLFGAIVTPVIKFVWSYTLAPDEFFNNYISVLQCIFYSGVFVLMFAATFFLSFVKKYAYYFVYAIYFLASFGLAYAVQYNNFSIQSVLIMLLFPASFTMLVKKMRHLIIYDLCTYSFILLALFTAEDKAIPRMFLILFFLFNYLFNYGFVRLRMKIQNSLIKREQDYRSLLEMTPQAIFVCQKDNILFCNSAAVLLAGAENTSALVNQPITRFLNYDEMLQHELVEDSIPASSIPKYHEEIFRRMDGAEVEVEASVAYVKLTGKSAMMYIIKDISERKATEKKIEQMAFYDPLTGLPNRNHLNNTLQEIIAASTDNKQESAVLFADLDGFKKVNDTLGHSNGDILLQLVAERLVKCVRSNDMVSRYGGDEFVIILNGSNESNAQTIAMRILNAFSLPFYMEGKDIYITPSIGISLYPKDGDTVGTLIKHADLAMYTAKDKGKNNFQYYSD